VNQSHVASGRTTRPTFEPPNDGPVEAEPKAGFLSVMKEDE
jgi:hypothetical protein